MLECVRGKRRRAPARGSRHGLQQLIDDQIFVSAVLVEQLNDQGTLNGWEHLLDRADVFGRVRRWWWLGYCRRRVWRGRLGCTGIGWLRRRCGTREVSRRGCRRAGCWSWIRGSGRLQIEKNPREKRITDGREHRDDGSTTSVYTRSHCGDAVREDPSGSDRFSVISRRRMPRCRSVLSREYVP